MSDADLDAAEYVLGMQSEAERSAFEQRLKSDPDLQRAVTRWAERFLPMVPQSDLFPAPDLLTEVELRLFGEITHMPRLGTSWIDRLLTSQGGWFALLCVKAAAVVALAIYLLHILR